MSSLHSASDWALDAREALRGLAHATPRIEGPRDVYVFLGDLVSGLEALTQSLHQLAEFHDATPVGSARVDGDSPLGRAASYQVAWEIHRAAEMVHQVTATLDRAHEVEATIRYAAPATPGLVAAPRSAPGPGLSL